MRFPGKVLGQLARRDIRPTVGRSTWTAPRPKLHNALFTRAKAAPRRTSATAAILTGGLVIWMLYPTDGFAELSTKHLAPQASQASPSKESQHDKGQQDEAQQAPPEDETAWASFARRFESYSIMTDKEWDSFSDKLADYMLPDWSKVIPGYIRKLQRELSVTPGSLAEELWAEAHDSTANPEIRYTAEVRVSDQLCDDEKEFLARRKKKTRAALAKYLDMNEKDIHPDDVPTIAMCGSGGGLRALVAGTGSLLAADEDGLFDCVTYTAGVSGSCWLQLLYLTSFNKGSIPSLLEHLKARTGTHIAYPPVALQSLVSLPTSKYLLSGVVEKLRGDKDADFGLVDVYGLLLGARFLVPKGELGVDERDFKISNQRSIIKDGDRPLPIYTAVRHEIAKTDQKTSKPKPGTKVYEEAVKKAKEESWFQWFEITPYEVFCEEIGAGIPTWALGRRFKDGKDVPLEHGFHLPEIRTPLLMGIFGSAFCATLSHYYKEVRPLAKSMTGFGPIDDLISDKDDELAKIHPIDPAIIPNYAYQMYGKLPQTATRSMYENEHMQLMDAGMSNNLPIYPLLRPGRDVDVLVTFDASADIKMDNWLSVADGYARQRGIKGWPIGIGWPKEGEPVSQTKKELQDAQAHSTGEAEQRVQQAKADQEMNRDKEPQSKQDDKTKFDAEKKQNNDLGYCTVWVGTTAERSTSEAPPATSPVADKEAWRLTEPDAGLAVIYLPFLTNPKVPGVSPGESDFMSTWNFVYTPEQIESVVNLARANYDEGRQQIRSTVRAVYERKKQMRLNQEKELNKEQQRRMDGRKQAALLGDGDQFS